MPYAPYGQPQKNGLAIAGFTLSAVAVTLVLLGFAIRGLGLGFIFVVPITITGVSLSAAAIGRANRGMGGLKGLAITGVILGSALLAFWAVALTVTLAAHH